MLQFYKLIIYYELESVFIIIAFIIVSEGKFDVYMLLPLSLDDTLLSCMLLFLC